MEPCVVCGTPMYKDLMESHMIAYHPSDEHNPKTKFVSHGNIEIEQDPKEKNPGFEIFVHGKEMKQEKVQENEDEEFILS